MDIRQAHEAYVAQLFRRRRAESTITATDRILNRFITLIQKQDLTEITEDDIDLYADHCTNIKPSSLTRYLNILSAFFKWCVRREHLRRSPMEDYGRPQFPQPIIRPLTLEQLEKLLAYKSRSRYGKLRYIDMRDWFIRHVLALAGLRIHECLLLKLEDFTPGGLAVHKGKGGKSRVVPVVPRLQKALDEYLPYLHWKLKHKPEASDYLFPGQSVSDGPLRTHSAYHHFERHCEVLGITNCGFHTLRHTYATMLRRAGAQPEELSKLLGHANPTITMQIYVHFTTDEIIATAMKHPLAN